jgi:Lrp/AsnC family leucine-responsive transcriptional regulator
MTKKSNSIITEKDILILKKLFEDGRKSSSSISKEIDMGREIINYRIKRLIKENLIVKFIPQINEKALHYQEYIVLLQLNLEDEVSKQEFVQKAIGNKYLVWTVKSDSGWDLIVRLFASSIDEFKEKLSEILESFSDVLTSYYTIISSDKIKEGEKEQIVKRLFQEDLPKKDFKVLKETETLSISLDEKDKKILQLLESDARIQYKEIAEDLQMSSDTVKYRIERMKEQNVIEKFMPVINFSKLGFFQFACVIRFNYLTEKEHHEISKYFQELPQVMRAIKSLNSEEYFLTLLFEKEKDVEEFKTALFEKFPSKLQLVECFQVD